ncbi:MAG: YbaK/EbsC family protein [Chloroflexota bacterium]
MAVESPRTEGPHAGLLDWLAGRHVEYELHEHPETFTAEATARAEHIDPRRFAKVVGVATNDGRRALLLVDAPDHVDLAKATRTLGAADVRLLTEPEFAALAPECDAGTIPPIPDLYGLPVYADFALRDAPMLSFHAGSHRYTVHVDRVAWERASGIAYADIARDDDSPAWAR